MDGLGVAWEATEVRPDTRLLGVCCLARFQVLRLELASGTHTLDLEPVTNEHPCGRPTQCTVRIEDGRNTYVLGLLARCPTDWSGARQQSVAHRCAAVRLSKFEPSISTTAREPSGICA